MRLTSIVFKVKSLSTISYTCTECPATFEKEFNIFQLFFIIFLLQETLRSLKISTNTSSTMRLEFLPASFVTSFHMAQDLM